MAAGEERSDLLRRSLRSVFIAWVFGAAWMHMTGGVALNRCAKLLALPPFGYGVLAAIPFAAALVQLPTCYFLERFGGHKPLFMITGVVHRMLWIAIGLVPLLLTGTWSWAVFLTVFLLSAMNGSMLTPAWIAWMAELVPARIRGRYFSRRSQAGQLVGLLVTPMVGWLLDLAGVGGPLSLHAVIALLFAAAAILGTIDIFCFTHIPAPRARPQPGLSLWHMLRGPLADRSFRRLLGFNATMTFAVAYVGQFVWLLILDVNHMSNSRANTLLMVLPIVVAMPCYPAWGRLIDRLGRKPVMRIAGLFVIQGAFIWIFVSGPHWWVAYIGVVLASIAWPAVDLASFNMLLSMGDGKGERRRISAYAAVNSLVNALSGMLSGLFAGAVAQTIGPWRGSLFGYPLTYHGVLLLISGVLRAIALLWLSGIEDKRSTSTREALQFMGRGLYSNLLDAVNLPGRLMVRVGQWTYKLNPGRVLRPR
jgi:MFS family permease